MMKQPSARRWIARARLGKLIPLEAIQNHPRLLKRFDAIHWWDLNAYRLVSKL